MPETPQLSLTFADFAVIAIYLGAMWVISAVAGWRQTSQESYFVGARNTSWWMAGISVLATLVSTLTYLSAPGEVIGKGIGYMWGQAGVVLAVPLINGLMIPLLMSLKVTSVYEFLERRFSLSVRLLAAAVFVVTRTIWVGLITLTASDAVHNMTGWPMLYLIIGISLFTAAYTMYGGLTAVLWTDFAQFLLLFGAALFVPFFVAYTTGSTPLEWWGLFSQVGRTQAPVWSFDPFVRMTVIGFILDTLTWNLCTHGADQVAAQRYLSTPNLKEARRSVITFSALSLATLGLLGLCGIAAFYHRYAGLGWDTARVSADSAKVADAIFPQFIALHLPIGIRGLVVAALLAAAMSSMSSGMNSVASVIMTDFVGRFRKGLPLASLGPARAVSLAVGVLGIGIAAVVMEIKSQAGWNFLEMIQRCNHLCVAPLGGLFLVGVLFRRANTAAVLAGFAAGIMVSVGIAFSKELFALEQAVSFMWVMPASLLATIAVPLAMLPVLPERPTSAT